MFEEILLFGLIVLVSECQNRFEIIDISSCN